MNNCRQCNSLIPNTLEIGGKVRVLNKRKFCLSCSPFGKHNTKPKLTSEILISKFCPKCGEDKLLIDFAKTSKKIQSYCKDCHNIACKQTIRKKKIKALAYKGGKCVDCEIRADEDNCVIFDFHHTEPEHKDIGIGNALRRSWSNIVQELDKCVLLCSNCHRLRHKIDY